MSTLTPDGPAFLSGTFNGNPGVLSRVPENHRDTGPGTVFTSGYIGWATIFATK